MILILLSLLMAGLLRSHAEILRRLGTTGEASAPRPVAAPSIAPAHEDGTDVPAPVRITVRAPDIAGHTLSGEPVQIAPAGARGGSLIAFLSSGCTTCQGFWDAFQPEVRQPIPGGARLIL